MIEPDCSELTTFPWKTLEFPYGSLVGILETGPANVDRTGPDTTVNQPESDSFGRTLKGAVSGGIRVDRVCHQKGSSHSGFSVIFVTDFNNLPF